MSQSLCLSQDRCLESNFGNLKACFAIMCECTLRLLPPQSLCVVSTCWAPHPSHHRVLHLKERWNLWCGRWGSSDQCVDVGKGLVDVLSIWLCFLFMSVVLLQSVQRNSQRSSSVPCTYLRVKMSDYDCFVSKPVLSKEYTWDIWGGRIFFLILKIYKTLTFLIKELVSVCGYWALLNQTVNATQVCSYNNYVDSKSVKNNITKL